MITNPDPTPMTNDNPPVTHLPVEAIHRSVAGGNLSNAFELILGYIQAIPDEACEFETLREEIHQHIGCLADSEAQFAGGAIKRPQIERERNRLTLVILELTDSLQRTASPRRATSHAHLRQRRAETSTGTPEVFFSYAHDDAALADAVLASLDARGFRVWFDQNLAGGERFKAVIDANIEASRAVVALWTPASIESDWVCYESTKARETNKLVPLRHRLLTVEAIPDEFPRDVHVLEFGDDHGLDYALRRLGCGHTLL